MRLKLNKYNPVSLSSSSSSGSNSSSDSNSSNSDSNSDSEVESNQGGSQLLTPASPDGKRRTPSSSSNSSNDSFRTAGDRTPESEDGDMPNLIPIDIPPKLIFKPKPRTTDSLAAAAAEIKKNTSTSSWKEGKKGKENCQASQIAGHFDTRKVCKNYKLSLINIGKGTCPYRAQTTPQENNLITEPFILNTVVFP